MLQTDALQMVFMSITSIIQQKDSHYNIKSCSASTAAIMATEQQAVNNTHDVVNVVKIIIPESAKVLPSTDFNAKVLIRCGIHSAQ